jgi:hypothetical protein
LAWYQRNYFCTKKLLYKDWIHKNIVADGREWRLYDTSKYGCENIFLNEVGWFFEYVVNNGLKIFYVKCSPKHNIIYNGECVNFFKNKRSSFNDVEMPENLKKLTKLQCEDLMYFYDNLILESFFIISKIKDNIYYYDMIITVKNDFNVENFYKINFNTVSIETITPIFYENITYSYMQQIFNFDELDFYGFYNVLDQKYYDIMCNPIHKELEEYKFFKKFEHEQFELGNNQMQHNNPLYWHYRNEYNGAVSEILDQKLMFKYYFSNFGWQWFVLNYNFKDMYKVEAPHYTYPINEPFLLTLDNIATPIAIVREGEIQEFNQQYETGCMLDLIDILSGCDNYFIQLHDISIPKIRHGTSYKCRLNKK